MNFDAIVVGGGIIGCTHAWHLAKRGLKTALVERAAPGQGTSAHNFSWINASTKTAHAPYHHLNAQSVSMYDALARDRGAANIGLNPIGALGIVRVGDATHYAALRSQAQILDSFGYSNRWLSTAELRLGEPGLVFADDAEALLTSADKLLDTKVFINFVLTEFRTLGGVLLANSSARELVTDENGAVSGLMCDTGQLNSSQVVLCVGPDTAQVLCDLTGYDGFARFPLARVPGLLVTTPPLPKPLVRHLNYTDTGGEFHFFPDFNGGLRLGSDDVDGQIINDTSRAHLRELAIGLLARMQDFAPEFGGPALIEQCDLAVGIRPYPEDGISIAGAFPGAQGLYVIATHSGVTLAPVLAELMADLVSTGDTPPMLADFGLERLPGF